MEELRRLLNDPFGEDKALTDREREIANLLAFDNTFVEVAKKLGVALGTVASLAARAKAKLGDKRFRSFTRLLLERIKEIVG